MVVDDEPGVLVLVGRFARAIGFDVVGQADGCDALASFPQARPNVART
jgi:CheY-like chemotaxis protein